MLLLLPLYPKDFFKEAVLQRKRRVGVGLFWGLVGIVSAQTDTLVHTKQMAAFEVSALREQQPNPALLQINLRGSKDAAMSGLSLAEVLQRESAVFVKQYGPSMLATPSLRGTGASHTALIWNGFNLQNAMNGQSDISLIPAFLFGSFTLQQGAASATWGSGAAGGALFLNANTQNETVFLQENGSFGHRLTAFRVALPFKKLRFSIGAYTLREQNNFRFHNLALAEAPLVEQHNAQLEASGLLASVSISTGPKSLLSISSWWQNAARHIPPIMSVPLAKAKQSDASLRNTLTYTSRISSLQVQIRAAWFEEQLHFADSLTSINQKYTSRTLSQEIEFSHSLGRFHKFGFGVNQNLQQVEAVTYYPENNDLNRFSTFAQWDAALLEERIKIRSGLRKEWTNQIDAPLIPFVSAAVAFSPKLTLSMNASGVYRIPTLNDLYWMPGGNPNLLPEQGKSTELGIVWNHVKGNASFSLRADVFQTLITNWILWVPGNAYWSPYNVQKVASRGGNLNAEFKFKCNLHQFTMRTSLQGVSAHVEKSGDAIDLHTGSQLIYVPRFTGVGIFEWRMGTNRIELQFTHTGLRYTSSDNLQGLPAYSLFNAIASKDFLIGKNKLNLYLRWNNILNTQYQVMLWRPMPMSSFQLGIQLTINTNKP